MTDLYSIQTQKRTFTNAQNHNIDAKLDVPLNVEPLCFAIICHCFTCTKETITTSRVSRGLAQKGIACLRFDFTGLGNSEGNFADTNFSTMVEDILSGARYLATEYKSPSVLIGHSMGGTAVLAASTEIESCQSVITIASPSQPDHVLHHFGSAMRDLELGVDAHINVAGVNYPIKPQFIDDVRNYDLVNRLKSYDKKLLSIRAGKDSLVPKEDADELIKYTSVNSKIFDLNNADHLFSNRQDTEKMIEQIASWIKEIKL